MSVLDSFFSKTGFKAAKCKTLLKLTIPRIKLLRNRREIQIKQMRKDIANLLRNGQEATARIRVEHIVREENMMAAQEIIELFCELIVVRLPIIETQRECPLDLKEAISSICFAAPRCSDLPELQQVQMHFAAKYGREFVAAATELRPDCGVNRQVIELLSVRAPSVEAKLKLLKEIAEAHEVDWDPAESEMELLKPHEDLLNGPNHLLGGSTAAPEGKDEDSLSSRPVEEQTFSSDEDIDYLDLPEVPKATVQPSPDPPVQHETFPPAPDSHPAVQKPTAPHIFSHTQASLPRDSSDPNYEHLKSIPSHEDPREVHHLENKSDKQQEPSANVSSTAKEKPQFVPFVSSPSISPLTSVSIKQDEPGSLKQSNQSKESTKSSSVSKNDSNVDLQDVIAAAHAAAETAERAAAAARAAASLAQVRITELVSKRSSQTSEITEDELHGEPQLQKSSEAHKLDKKISSGSFSGIPRMGSDSPTFPSHDQSPDETEHHTSHQPQRSTSLDDDPYFSYPNLFTPQNSFRRS